MKFLIIFLTILGSLLTSNGVFGKLGKKYPNEILGVIPFDSKSHFVIGETIMKSLAEFFHNMTVISHHPQKQDLHFFKDVSIAEGTSDFNFGYARAPSFLDLFEFERLPILGALKFLYENSEETVDYVMTNPNVIQLIESGKTFNACIIENTHFEALLGLAEVFQCVLITYTTYPSIQLIDKMTSNISPLSYVPNAFLDYTTEMSFKQRFWNVLNSLIEKLFYEFYHLPNQKRLYEKYFPNAKNSFDDVIKNSSIVFINRHTAAFGAVPRLPNMIDIGGIHVKQAKALKPKLQNILDSAKHGVILFTMGSIMQGIDWPDEHREAFVKAFSKLKQKVIWKYENETLPNKPENVKIAKWLPQRNILAHPNVKLFITHGGLAGFYEAEVSGVPILGIPIFGDQHMNVANAVSRGYGLKLDFSDITEEKVSSAIEELLNNPKYKESALKASSQFKERGMTPKLSVIYWTDYAIKYQGAPHLRHAGNQLSYFELNSLDVYLTFALIIAAVIAIKLYVCKKIMSKICKRNKNVDKKKKKE